MPSRKPLTWIQEYHKRSNETSTFIECLKKETEYPHCQHASSCIVANSRSTQASSLILQNYFPNLQKFFCLETDRDLLEILKDQLQHERQKRRGGLEVRLKLQRVGTWAGPSGSCRVIFLFNIEESMNEYVLPNFFRKCNSWLSPGGALYILVQKACDNWQKLMKDVTGNARMTERPTLKMIRAGLQRAGMTIQQERTFAFTTDIEYPNHHLLSYFLQRPSSEEELYNFIIQSRERFPSLKVKFNKYILMCKKV